jgi:hypothetical protein
MGLASLLGQVVRATSSYHAIWQRLSEKLLTTLAASIVTVSRNGEGSRPLPAPELQPAVILENETGGFAIGMFLVENCLNQAVSAPVAPSSFVAEDGHEVRPRLAFAPSTVSLEPGAQSVVKIAAVMDGSLRPGVAYRGTISVPGMSRAVIPVVIRRRVTPPRSEAAGPAVAASRQQRLRSSR